MFNNYSVRLLVDEKPINLELYDTAGQEDFDNLRPLSYSDTNVFLLGYSISAPDSFANITSRWMKELEKQAPGVPFVLVGTKMDTRDEAPAKMKDDFVSTDQGEILSKQIKAFTFVECSALKQTNLKKVFDEACRCVFEFQKEHDTKRLIQPDGSFLEVPRDPKVKTKSCCILL